LKDLPIHIEDNCEEWKLYCQKPECTTLPPPWNLLEPLEQLLIVKHLKPAAFLTSVTVDLIDPSKKV
jgi:hypothetical protein